jgi:hypothetical protein
MGQEFHATYEHGILRLDVPLLLPEQTRVTGIVSNVDSSIVSGTGQAEISPEEFERLLDELALNDVPPLPADFSRTDIYLDHD